MTIKDGNLEHGHKMAPNPCSYHQHRTRHPITARAIELATTHRKGGLSFAKNEAVLAEVDRAFDEILHISQKKYYKLVPSTTRDREELIAGLLLVLDDDRWTTHIRYSYEHDARGISVRRTIQQIFFIDKEQSRRDSPNGSLATSC